MSPGEKDKEKAVHCANCSDKIIGKPFRQDKEFFCSLECANLASGVDSGESQEDPKQDPDDKRYEDFFPYEE